MPGLRARVDKISGETRAYARDLALAVDGQDAADTCLMRLLEMFQATALNAFRLTQPRSLLPGSLEPARSPGLPFADAAETRAVLAVRLHSDDSAPLVDAAEQDAQVSDSEGTPQV